MLSWACLVCGWIDIVLHSIRRQWLPFVLASLLAAAVPCFVRAPAVIESGAFPGWPGEFQGQPLQALPLTALEQRFAERFPGRIARFNDGSREILLRWVAEPTRKLHPAKDCFRGSGYRIETLPIRVDAQGQRWSRFHATRGPENLLVEERIWDAGNGQWTDVSAWYWAAFWQKSAGPWWAATVAN